MSKNKMNKNIVPDDFTLSLALVDAVPVIFFGLSAIVLGTIVHSFLFIFGACLCLFAGAAKVLWKIIVVLKKKNIWFLFIQMRIMMPIGFLLMIISLFINHQNVSWAGFVKGFTSMPSFLFFLIGICGMGLMGYCGTHLDSSDVKSNWIEQCINGVAQIAIFIGLILLK